MRYVVCCYRNLTARIGYPEWQCFSLFPVFPIFIFNFRLNCFIYSYMGDNSVISVTFSYGPSGYDCSKPRVCCWHELNIMGLLMGSISWSK